MTGCRPAINVSECCDAQSVAGLGQLLPCAPRQKGDLPRLLPTFATIGWGRRALLVMPGRGHSRVGPTGREKIVYCRPEHRRRRSDAGPSLAGLHRSWKQRALSGESVIVGLPLADGGKSRSVPPMARRGAWLQLHFIALVSRREAEMKTRVLADGSQRNWDHRVPPRQEITNLWSAPKGIYRKSLLNSQIATPMTLANIIATLPNVTNPMRVSKTRWPISRMLGKPTPDSK
jgi:hypothetical protein